MPIKGDKLDLYFPHEQPTRRGRKTPTWPEGVPIFTLSLEESIWLRDTLGNLVEKMEQGTIKYDIEWPK